MFRNVRGIVLLRSGNLTLHKELSVWTSSHHHTLDTIFTCDSGLAVSRARLPRGSYLPPLHLSVPDSKFRVLALMTWTPCLLVILRLNSSPSQRSEIAIVHLRQLICLSESSSLAVGLMSPPCRSQRFDFSPRFHQRCKTHHYLVLAGVEVGKRTLKLCIRSEKSV